MPTLNMPLETLFVNLEKLTSIGNYERESCHSLFIQDFLESNLSVLVFCGNQNLPKTWLKYVPMTEWIF